MNNSTRLLLGPIIGGLSNDRALLWGRAKPVDETATLHAWIGRQPNMSDAELGGQSLPLSPEQGYTGVALLAGLRPEIRYYYALRLSDSPPTPGSGPLEGGLYPSFRTFPSPGELASFNFAFGSCFRPAAESAGKIFDALEARRKMDDLRFILLIGDQIYADDYKANSLGKVAETLDEYRAVYKYVWGWPSFRRLLFNLPAFMTLDDHEVDDDWRWLDMERRTAYIPWWDRFSRLLHSRPFSETRLPLERVRNALQAYWEHQGMHAPPLSRPLDLNPAGQYALLASDSGSLAYTFEYGGAAFFVMDTRTMRVKPRWGGERTMLGEGQWRALQKWLLKVKDAYPLKFLVSSCSLLFCMWADIPRDRWLGFPHERDRLLSFLATHGIEGVYVLSGDLHSAHAIHAGLFGPQGNDLPLWEFCSSPFEQKPNRLARSTRVKISNRLFKWQDCKFVIDQLNFGVVRVSYDQGGKPQVRFDLYGEHGGLLAQIST